MKDVAYGAKGKWAYQRNVTEGIACDNDTFGDPISGVKKSCYTRESAAKPDQDGAKHNAGGPSGWKYCTSENQYCNFRGMKDVAYGAKGQWAYQHNVTEGIACDNDTFGDPISGVKKSCYTRESAAKPDRDGTKHNAGGPSGWKYCTSESQYCSFKGMKDVAYGAKGKWAYQRNVTDGISCDNDTFGDPISGVKKSCYIRESSAKPGQDGGKHHKDGPSGWLDLLDE